MTLRLRPFFFAAIALLVLLSACTPAAIPVTGGSATFVPTPPPPDAGAIVDAVPLGPPAMQVGSAYRYFDGSLLDAVPGGAFPMGPANAQQQVTLSDFWIYSTEVSNQMYAWCVSVGKCSAPDPKDNPAFHDPRSVNNPVVGVTWQQAADYCAFAHGALPTEAQWEKAATWDASLSQKRPYPWGSTEPSCDLLNFKQCYGKAASVLQFGQGQSFYGAYNLEGNVAEWAADWFQPNLQETGQDPAGPASGTQRSIRGAAFDTDASLASPTQRFSSQPTAHRPNLGFRCVVKDPAFYAPFCQMPVFYGINPAGSNAVNPCPDPSIEHLSVCGLDNGRHDLITIHTGGSTLVQIRGLETCSPATDDVGVRHDCGPNTTVQVTALCSAQPAGAATCPPNYHQDPNNPAQCIAPGGPGSCPAGFQYDTSMQCCSAASSGSIAPLCSVGQHLYNGACVDDGSGLIQPNSIMFQTGTDMSCLPGTALPNTGGLIVFATNTVPPLPTATSVPPTNPPQPTPTPFPSNTPPATNIPPTNTPVPPTDTSAPPPTNTDVSPSDTPAPPPTDVPTDVPPTDPPPSDTPAA